MKPFADFDEVLIREFNKSAIITSDRSISYREMLQHISEYSEILSRNENPNDIQKRVAIISENREAFVYAFFAILYLKQIAIPIDTQLDFEKLGDLLSDCKPSAIWASQTCYDTVRKAVSAIGETIPILLLDEMERKPTEPGTLPAQIQFLPQQIATIIYTSGTQGQPKGVLLSFQNLLTNVYFVSKEVKVCTPERRAILLLPLYHIFPLVATLIVPILIGAGIAIPPSMSFNDIVGTMKKSKVGLLVGVPKLWQMFYENIMVKINASLLSRTLYKLCGAVNNLNFSRLIFRKFHNSLGGKVEACPSGGAALDPKVWKGMKTLGIEIIEGYGMTECGPLIAFNRPGESKAQCVGKTMSGCLVKIVDEEICVKGENVMPGYLNRPEETEHSFDEEGWFHTGDIGYLDDDNRLYITGRKKDLIVLSNGKKIMPEEIESYFLLYVDLVKECAVFQTDDLLNLIIYPNEEISTERLNEVVIDKYNASAPVYKLIRNLFVSKEPLPRTRMDKLRRDLLSSFAKKCSKISDQRQEDDKPSLTANKVLDFFSDKTTTIPSINNNLFTGFGMDSLMTLEFQCFLETTFCITLSQRQLVEMGTIQSISDYIDKNSSNSSFDKIILNYDYLKKPKQQIEKFDKKAIWRILKLSEGLLKKYFNLTLIGRENIPDNRQFIMVSNHQSYIDTLFLLQGFKSTQFDRMTILAKKEHFNNLFLRIFAKRHRIVLLDQNNIKESLLEFIDNIKSGANALIFPEGTRTINGKTGEFKKTFAIISKSLNIPVVPVCIKGAFEAMPKNKKIPNRHNVTVTFSHLINPSDFITVEDLSAFTKQTIDKI